MSTFREQVIIITGASSGIGKATAIKLAKDGAVLALADINTESLALTLQQCAVASNDSQKHLIRRLDVCSTTEIERFVQDVMAELGSITHVFNCAGINPTTLEISQITDDYWHKMIDTNLKSIFTMTRACLQYMKSGGSFVNVSSVLGLHPTEGLGVYCATKYAVIGMSKCLALETGRRGIRVNVICPGPINTPTNNSVRKGKLRVDATAATIGLGRLGTAEEVADVVGFLFSEQSRYVNGSVVEVNGGMGMPA
jgi:NAD(P)-dependent dehydrogenase (short-subunit alcohol dehydrogenase family)